MTDLEKTKTLTRKKTSCSQIVMFERGLTILIAIKNTPVATIKGINKNALPDIDKRTIQRYVKGFEERGYVRRKCHGCTDEARFFLTDKAKQALRGDYD